jgi:hypothetical protein
MRSLSRSLTILAALALPLLASSSALADSVCNTIAGNLVVNSGFETGDFTGWTSIDPTNSSGVGNDNPNSGSFEADLGAFGPAGTLSQTITDTSGLAYYLGFELDNQLSPGFTGADNFEVTVTDDLNNTTVLFNSSVAQSASYALYGFDFTGSGSDTITFTDLNEPSYYDLDDVVVIEPTPEPGSLVLLGTGVLVFAGLTRRKINSAAQMS